MTIAASPKEYEPCVECGGESFSRVQKTSELGVIYECDNCGKRLFAYDNSEHGRGQSFSWNDADAVLKQIATERECRDCGHTWRYTGTADRPTCPNCKGKNTREKDPNA